ncbi:lmo0937 family membrane protein [Clostridium psychrophilum]|nr:lmo0937 family membrane protein [Clostridium psychrophilum]MBU3181705.1 lmo0937 family membrane protein [Clostridium psychrophilum]
MGFLRWLIGIIMIFWLLGFILNIGGGMIHILLVIAVIIFIYDFVMGRRR